MAIEVFNKGNQDLDGTIENVDRELSGRWAKYLWQIDNDLDVAVDYHVYGTHGADDDFSDGYELTNGTQTVSAGDSVAETLTDSWDQIRIELDPQSDPTSGDLIVREMVVR